jgi:hypothetical protein
MKNINAMILASGKLFKREITFLLFKQVLNDPIHEW